MREIDYGYIRLNLDRVLKEQGIKLSDLTRHVGQKSQIESYCKGTIRRVDLGVLTRICYTLECDISDILEYVSPEQAARERREPERTTDDRTAGGDGSGSPE